MRKSKRKKTTMMISNILSLFSMLTFSDAVPHESFPSPHIEELIYSSPHEISLKKRQAIYEIYDNQELRMPDTGSIINAALRSAYPAVFLEDELVYAAITRFIETNPPPNSASRLFSVLNPMLRNGIRDHLVDNVRATYADAKLSSLILFPYGTTEHWFLMIYDTETNHFFVCDSAKRDIIEDYSMEIEVFSYILREYLEFETVPESSNVLVYRPESETDLYPSLQAMFTEEYQLGKKATLWDGAWQQTDGNSCGVFTLIYAAYFVKHDYALHQIFQHPEITSVVPLSEDAALVARRNLFLNLVAECHESDPVHMNFPHCVGVQELGVVVYDPFDVAEPTEEVPVETPEDAPPNT